MSSAVEIIVWKQSIATIACLMSDFRCPMSDVGRLMPDIPRLMSNFR